MTRPARTARRTAAAAAAVPLPVAGSLLGTPTAAAAEPAASCAAAGNRFVVGSAARIGLEGRCLPAGAADSAGCLHATNHDMRRLMRAVPLGAPVLVRR